MKFRVPDQLLLPWSPQQTISAERAAEMLKTSRRTILRMIESGEISAYKLREGRSSGWKIHYESVLKYLDKMHEKHGLERRFSI